MKNPVPCPPRFCTKLSSVGINFIDTTLLYFSLIVCLISRSPSNPLPLNNTPLASYRNSPTSGFMSLHTQPIPSCIFV